MYRCEVCNCIICEPDGIYSFIKSVKIDENHIEVFNVCYEHKDYDFFKKSNDNKNDRSV